MALCVLSLLVTAVKAEAVTITEFPLSITNSAPLGIAPGPDGNVWFTENRGHRFGRITPAGKIDDFSTGSGISADALPAGIRSDPTATSGSPRRHRAGSPAQGHGTGRPQAPSSRRASPPEPARGHHRGARRQSLVHRVFRRPHRPDQPDRSGHRVRGRSDRPGACRSASPPDRTTSSGSPTLRFPDNPIGRMAPLGDVRRVHAGITPDSEPARIIRRPRRQHLVHRADRRTTIGRITTAGVVTEFSSGISAGAGPVGITVGPDGNIWFAEYGGSSDAHRPDHAAGRGHRVRGPGSPPCRSRSRSARRQPLVHRELRQPHRKGSSSIPR